MTDLKLTVNVALVVAVIAGEIVSTLWYSEAWPWGRLGDRYLLTALVCDVGLAFLLQFISESYYSVRSWEDAAFLAMWLTLAYSCLEAPYGVHNAKSLSRFFYHALHKFVMMFVMLLALWHFKKY